MSIAAPPPIRRMASVPQQWIRSRAATPPFSSFLTLLVAQLTRPINENNELTSQVAPMARSVRIEKLNAARIYFGQIINSGRYRPVAIGHGVIPYHCSCEEPAVKEGL